MEYQFQPKKLGYGRKVARLPTGFFVACVIVFSACVMATVYFIGSMGYEMNMPGGWKMSMMWMRMPGQTWLQSTLGFLLMWLAMMVAMMLPSALPMFVKTQRQWRSLCCMASGYFTIWLLAGFGIYILGIWFNSAAMRSASVSRAVPLLSGAALVAAGSFQLTRRKMNYLLHCRSKVGCAVPCFKDVTSFRLGCKQGATCCACCAALMTAQLLLGIMNPLVMIVVAIVIAAEKLLLQPEVTARLSGIAAIVVGIVVIVHWATVYYA